MFLQCLIEMLELNVTWQISDTVNSFSFSLPQKPSAGPLTPSGITCKSLQMKPRRPSALPTPVRRKASLIPSPTPKPPALSDSVPTSYTKQHSCRWDARGCLLTGPLQITWLLLWLHMQVCHSLFVSIFVCAQPHPHQCTGGGGAYWCTWNSALLSRGWSPYHHTLKQPTDWPIRAHGSWSTDSGWISAQWKPDWTGA